MKPAVIPDDRIPLNSRESVAPVPPTEEGHPSCALFRYGMLACTLGIFGYYIHWLVNVPPRYPYDRYGVGIISTMLVFNHLSYSFRWSRKTALVLRVVSIGLIVFAGCWVSYLGPQLFPLTK